MVKFSGNEPERHPGTSDKDFADNACNLCFHPLVNIPNKYVCLRGRPYIHTCRSYACQRTGRIVQRTGHTCRQHVWSDFLRVCQSGTAVLNTLFDSSNFGLLGEQNFPKCTVSCLGSRWTAMQNLMPLALSSAEKSVTVQTHTKLQTNSNRYIHTLPISMCG